MMALSFLSPALAPSDDVYSTTLFSGCLSLIDSDLDLDGDEIDPLDTALTRVVVASAGEARFDFAFPRVNCRGGDLFVLGLADSLTEETTSEAVSLAEDILSRAT